MSLRQQLRRRKLRSTSHRKMTGSRRCRKLVLCKREFLRIKKLSGAQGEAPEENEASDDEWKIKLNKLTQKLPSARCRRLGHQKDNHSCLVRV